MTAARLRILNYIRECEHSPTVREIGQFVGLASPSTVHRHLRELQKDGLVGYENGRIYARKEAA